MAKEADDCMDKVAEDSMADEAEGSLVGVLTSSAWIPPSAVKATAGLESSVADEDKETIQY